MPIKLKINESTGSIIYPKDTETNDKQWMTEEGWNGVEVFFWLEISVQANIEALTSVGGDSNQLYNFIYKKK